MSSLEPDSTPSASEVIKTAKIRAAYENKNVLVVIHASWCPWCRRFDALFDNPRFKTQFENSYTFAQITVRERDERQNLENLGWEPIFRELRESREVDVPFIAILSPAGEKMAVSYRDPSKEIPGNVGFPRTDDEIRGFLSLVRSTGKGFSEEDLLALKQEFQRPA